MADGTADDLKTLRAEMANLRADLGKIGETLKSFGRHSGEEAAEKAGDMAEKLRAEIERKSQRLAEGIEQKPLTSVLAAFGVGMILGMLFHGRRS